MNYAPGGRARSPSAPKLRAARPTIYIVPPMINTEAQRIMAAFQVSVPLNASSAFISPNITSLNYGIICGVSRNEILPFRFEQIV